ncbi:MAG: hypothetical protein ACREPB_12780 [Arenimonas sp.]
MQLDEVHIAYCHYYATGEGVSIFIALGGSYKHAESIFKKHVPEYFHLGLVIRPISLKEEEVERFLPLPVLDLFATNPSGTTEYFSTVHYNLS